MSWPQLRFQNQASETYTIDVKFASGIKNIYLGFYPYTDVCLKLMRQGCFSVTILKGSTKCSNFTQWLHIGVGQKPNNTSPRSTHIIFFNSNCSFLGGTSLCPYTRTIFTMCTWNSCPTSIYMLMYIKPECHFIWMTIRNLVTISFIGTKV